MRNNATTSDILRTMEYPSNKEPDLLYSLGLDECLNATADMIRQPVYDYTAAAQPKTPEQNPMSKNNRVKNIKTAYS